MRGISIFLADRSFEENYEYMKRMKSAGFNEIFTTLHMPEDDIEVLKKRLIQIGAAAKELEMKVMADISGKVIQHFSVEGLAKLGITGLRMDYGFTAQEIADFSKQTKIALNASTLTEEFLVELQQCGMHRENVEAWHNYYPRPQTGLDEVEFIEKNKALQAQGVTTMAFIPGDGLKRKPLFESLPTLEKHRNQSSFLAYLDMQNCFVDKIFIGDLTITDWTLQQFQAYSEDVIPLRVQKEQPYPLWSIIHHNRLDAARDVVRSENARTDERRFGQEKRIAPANCVIRSKGSVTLDNELYGRYEGELQITLTDLPADKKVNVLGRIVEEDVPLLNYVKKGGSRFSFHHVEMV